MGLSYGIWEGSNSSSDVLFSSKTKTRSAQRFLPIQCRLHRGAPRKLRDGGKTCFQRSLRSDPDFADSLSSWRIYASRTRSSPKPRNISTIRQNKPQSADGYYKLAMAERSLHQTAAAQREISASFRLSLKKWRPPDPIRINTFSTISTTGPRFLPSNGRNSMSSEVTAQIQKHPGSLKICNLLAEAY